MERKFQLVEERAVNVIHSSQKKEMEAEELRRELEEARIAERAAKMQLIEATASVSGPQSPPTTVAMTTATATSSNNVTTTSVAAVSEVRSS